MSDSKYKKYKLIKDWVKYYTEVLHLVFPRFDKKDIKDFLYDLVEENIKVPNAKIDNNYVHASMKFDLLSISDWIEDTKPIIGGHGVFFRNQNQVINPAAQMLINSMSKRKEFKDQLKVYKEDTYEYDMYDRFQQAEKVVSNSFYGASGASSSDFFNLYTATCTTSTAQSLISTAMLTFEAFMANNIQFYNIDDCFNYLIFIKNEKYNYSEDFLPPVFPEMLYERLVSMFHEWKEEYAEPLMEFVYSCSSRLLKRLYYKNNLYEFSDIPVIQELLHGIFLKVDEFKNPNKIPKEIEQDINQLWDYYKQFVFSNQFYFGRIKRLKAFKRKCVVAIDTDSNMVSVDPWIKYLRKRIINNDNRINCKTKEQLDFICVNTICVMLTRVISESLNKYTKTSNILKDFRPRINMKNEFYFIRMVLTPKKKRYASAIKLREGKEFEVPKIDVKGADFMKSSVRIETKEFFENLLKEEMLLSGTIDRSRILRRIAEFENIIKESLKKGERHFLIPKNAKEPEAYANPYGQQAFRSVLLWNAVYPDNAIQLPEKIDMVKMDLVDDIQLEKLKVKYPDIYDIIDKNILQHPNKKYAEKKAGVIAIPSYIDKIPDWILEFTDYDTIIMDNVTKFNSFIDSMGAVLIKGSTNNEHFSNIIKI